MMTRNKKIFFGFLLGGLVPAGLLYLLYIYGFVDYFTDRNRLVNFIHAHRAYAALIFIGLQTLQVVAAPLPGEVTGFAGGVLFGPVAGILYSSLGLALGSWTAFLLARFAGRPLVETVIHPETIKRYDYVMKHKGMFLAFLMFLIPGFPKDILCYLLGLGHMRQRDFLLVSTSGRLLGTTLLTLGGAFLRDERYGALFTLAGICIFFILLALVFRGELERRFRKQRAPARRRRSRAPHTKEK
jgi:uncharacterized membrane protein YdjX (TVP38/TMEM64 family)